MKRSLLEMRFPNIEPFPSRYLEEACRVVQSMDDLCSLKLSEGDSFFDCDYDYCTMLGPISRGDRIVIEYNCKTKNGDTYRLSFDPDHVTAQLAAEWKPLPC